MVKTMTKSETKLLIKIMPAYYSYIKKHPHSLLTKYFGMHRVKPHRKQAIYFVVMGSVFHSEGMENLTIHKQYDLKGSVRNRRAKPGESMGKDIDFCDDGIFLRIEPDKARKFREQMRSDVEFLRKL